MINDSASVKTQANEAPRTRGGAVHLPLGVDLELGEQMKGQKQTAEHIAARSTALKGRKAWNKGKRWKKTVLGKQCGPNNPRWQPDRDLVKARLKAQRFMRDSLRRLLVNKTSTSAEVVGYDKDALITHLESQFLSNMNWGNYGNVWEIDHVRPVAQFVSEGVTDPRVINALSNLRPLSKSANRRKRDAFITGAGLAPERLVRVA